MCGGQALDAVETGSSENEGNAIGGGGGAGRGGGGQRRVGAGSGAPAAAAASGRLHAAADARLEQRIAGGNIGFGS